MQLRNYCCIPKDLQPSKITWAGTAIAGLFFAVFAIIYLLQLLGVMGSGGKWLTLSGKDIDKSKQWFDKHGGIAVSFCRLVPGVRTLISVPAGIDNMHLVPFLLYSTVGTALWVGVLSCHAFKLGISTGQDGRTTRIWQFLTIRFK